MSFLIVDDNATMRRTIARVVREVASEINECVDGDDICGYYRRLKPDWVLMDIEMRGTDGLSATENLLAEFPVARVVIVTKFADTAMRRAASEIGAVAFVNKENLLALIGIVAGVD